MKRRVQLLVALSMLAAVCSVVVLPAFAGGGHGEDKRFAIGFRLDITGLNPTTFTGTAAGPFSAAGAVSDSGTSNSTFKITPTGHDRGTLKGTQTFTRGPHDSITAHFRGTTFPLSSPRATGRGHFRITGGTGAYAHLTGRGDFLVVGDFTTATVTGTFDGKAKTH